MGSRSLLTAAAVSSNQAARGRMAAARECAQRSSWLALPSRALKPALPRAREGPPRRLLC
jgi:hypothetical protein